MDNKKKTIILISLFIILMIGASVLYNNLSTNYKPDSLSVENSNSEDSAQTTTDTNPDNSDADSSSTSKTETSSDTSSEETASKTENIAPDFTVYDIDGNKINLSDFFGKPTIVNFWASWCGPCKMEMPDFNEAYAAYKDEINFLMVNMTDGSRETVEKASSFITESGYLFPVYYDTDYSAAITYSVSSLPTTYFLDSEGNLAAHAKGAIDSETLQKGINMIYQTE